MSIKPYPDIRKWNGECRLVLDGTLLSLVRYNGCHLVIDGKQKIIPQAGVTLAPTGLTASTTYYIYASMVGDQMALEASTTGHGPDARNGVEVKSGDATRTLVGMARTTSGAAWTDTATQRFVRTYYNRNRLAAKNVLPSSVSTSSATPVELSTGVRCEFVSWSDDVVSASVNGAVRSGVDTNSAPITYVGIDGSYIVESYSMSNVVASSDYNIATSGLCSNLSEGYHYITIMACDQNARTSTWYGATAGKKCAIIATIE